MKGSENPLYLRRLECPVCKTVNEFETIRLGAYTETGRDTDFCPTGRTWQNPRYENTNPLLYFMTTCVSCFYTREFNTQYREWKSDTTFRTYRQKKIRQHHLAALADVDGPMRRLGSSLWPGSYPTPTAINKFLLGIMDEQMLDEPSDLDLGRWYLRIGWLFREAAGGGLALASPHQQRRRELLSAMGSLQEASGEVSRRLFTAQSIAEDHPEAAAQHPEDHDRPLQCREHIEELRRRFDALAGGITDLLEWLDPDESPVVGDAELPGTDSYGEYSSYGAFLAVLKDDWQGIPLNENEALQFSLKHYQRAYEVDSGMENGNAQIQVVYLIGELARRTGDNDAASQYLSLAARLGREWIHKLNSDRTQTALARHIVDLATQQARLMAEVKTAIA